MHRSPGFTLLELLIVIGVLSVLMGLGLGYLGHTDPKMIANSVLAGELRAAQMTARAEGVPTEVVLRPGVDNEAATVQSRLLRPVVAFHFEPNEQVEDEVLRPLLLGEDVPGGRFGHARRPPLDGKGSLLHWPAPPSVLDLRDGFVVRLDLWLDRRGAATVLRLPPAVELTVDADAHPRAVVRLHGLGGDTNSRSVVASELPLPIGRWCTLDVGCDGRTMWMTLDGRSLGQSPAEGTPQQEPDSVFDVVPEDGPIAGMVDEVRWFVYAFSPAQLFPREVVLDRIYRFGFDARGEATERPDVRFGLPEEGS